MPNAPDITHQYQATLTTAAVYHRTDRGLIELQGKDRATWLNNLVTNVITTLNPGEANYAFALNVQGRCVFDLNMLVLEDRIWLDIDRRLIDKARTHLERYIITEDATLTDLTEHSRRIALVGPRAHEVVDQLGFGNLIPMAWLQHTAGNIENAKVHMMRHDFIGLIGADFLITGENTDTAAAKIESTATELGFAAIERPAIEILRIEEGIPASVDDIDENVVPPETGQIERGISYHKGCYLGQEVIERMRSHGVLPRKLVGLRFDGEELVPPQSKLTIGDQEVGRVLSGCYSETIKSILTLAYIKAAHSQPDTSVVVHTEAGPRHASIIALPVRK